MLVEHHGRLVTKDELMRIVWPATAVEEANLAQQVFTLRRLLGDDPERPAFIATVPRRGYRFVADVVELHEPGSDPISGSSSESASGQSAPPRPWGRRGVWFVVLGLAAIAAAWAAGAHPKPPARPATIRFEVSLPAGATLRPELGVAGISPDGQWLAFVADDAGGSRLWIRRLDTGVTRPLTGTEGVWDPFWSPNSEQLGFFAGRRLKTVSVAGAPPREICEIEDAVGGSWAPDGTIVFAPSSRSPLFRVAAAGGRPDPLTVFDAVRRDITHRFPLVMPDGKHVLYLVWAGDTSRQGVLIATLDGREVGRLLPDQSPVGYVPGYLLFIRREMLVAQAFDSETLRLSGEPIAVESPVARNPSDRTPFAASASRAITFVRSREETRLSWFDRQGHQLSVIGGQAQYSDPAISPDGRRVAFSFRDRARGNDNFDLWVLDQHTGTRTRLTFEGAVDTLPVFSPDGRSLLFRSNRSGVSDLYRKQIDTGQPEELLYTSPQRKDPSDWSRDGRTVLFTQYAPRNDADLWILRLGPPASAESVVRRDGRQAAGRLSPDGRFLAYESSEGGSLQIFVQELGADRRQWQVTAGGGTQPQWRADGRELYFLSGPGLSAIDVAWKDGTPSFGAPHVLLRANFGPGLRNSFVPTADGQRFLILEREEPEPDAPLTVVVNWHR